MKHIIFITGPSNSGKDTLRKSLKTLSEMDRFSSWNVITMHTTRPARNNEAFSVDYYFDTLHSKEELEDLKYKKSFCFSTYTNADGENWYYWIDPDDIKEDKVNIIFAGSKELEWARADMDEEGSEYDIVPFLLNAKPSIIMDRARERILSGNDHMPKEVFRRMYADAEIYGNETFIKSFHTNVIDIDGIHDLLHLIQAISRVEKFFTFKNSSVSTS